MVSILLNALFVFEAALAGSLVEKVIQSGESICRQGGRKCVKPVNVEGSNVAAISIEIGDNKKVKLITYDKQGNKVKLSKKYKVKVKANKKTGHLDAEIVKK